MPLDIELPQIGATGGVLAAGMINDAITLLEDTAETHDHITYGGAITPAAININTDLTLQQNALLESKYVGFKNHLTAYVPSGGQELYVREDAPASPTGDLWYNNGSIDIQITDGAAMLTTTDGLTDDYNNTPNNSTGMLGYSIVNDRYRFSKGNGINAGASFASGLEANQVISSDNGSRLGTTLASWELSFVGGIVTMNGDCRPNSVDFDTSKPYARGSQNAIVARVTVDGLSDPPSWNNQECWNIADITGTSGDYIITLHEPITEDTTLMVTVDSSGLAAGTNNWPLLVGTAEWVSNTQVRVNTAYLHDVWGAFPITTEKQPSKFHFMAVGMPAT